MLNNTLNQWIKEELSGKAENTLRQMKTKTNVPRLKGCSAEGTSTVVKAYIKKLEHSNFTTSGTRKRTN